MHKEISIMAHWPVSGTSLATIDYTKYSVGVIKYFLKHVIKFQSGQEEHLFCYITWKQQHPLFNWFEQSAVVTSIHIWVVGTNHLKLHTYITCL